MDYLTLGPSPAGEPCVQVGEDNYSHDAQIECKRYKKQLETTFPVPEGVEARFAIKSFPHDFGTYYEVVVKFDENSEEAVEFAYNVESNLPESWEE